MRTQFVNPLRKTISSLLLGTGLLLVAGCAGEVYTTAPGGYYAYDYYPAWDVYFYPQGHVYYWNDGGHWRSGREIPNHYHFRENEEREHLQLHTRQPWTEHRSARPEFQGHYR